MNEQEINNLIDRRVNEILSNIQNVASVPYHTHNGVDSPVLTPATALIGFPTIEVTDATVAPTDTPINGIIRIQYDATKWHLWVRVNNLWKGEALT